MEEAAEVQRAAAERHDAPTSSARAECSTGCPSPPSGQYTYYPGTSEVPEQLAASTHGVSFKILAEVEFAAESQGVIVAQGSRFGGYSLFVKGGTLDLRLQLPRHPARAAHLAPRHRGRHAHRRRGVHQGAHGRTLRDRSARRSCTSTTGRRRAGDPHHRPALLRALRRGPVRWLRRRRRRQQRVQAEVRVLRRQDRQGDLRRRRRRATSTSSGRWPRRSRATRARGTRHTGPGGEVHSLPGYRVSRTQRRRSMSGIGTRDPLPSWNDTPTRRSIIDFVAAREPRVGRFPPEERIAVFDNDGTLWCEKPMPVELGFILQRLARMAEHDPALRERQPWKAAYTKDYAWLGGAMTKHYQGDDSDVKVLIGGLLRAFAGIRSRTTRLTPATSSYRAAPDASAAPSASAPTGRWSSCCATWRRITSRTTSPPAATGTSCARSPSRLYGIPPERVIGSSNALATRRMIGAAWSYTAKRRTCSTMARRSRCASGAASGGDQSWPPATRMATSRC